MNVNKKLISIGGQGVFEGVMMRSPNYMAIAVRKSDGTIEVKKEKLNSLAHRYKFLKWAFFRGILMLFETLILSFKAIAYSADETMEEEMSKKEIALTFIFAFAAAILLFIVLPLYLTKLIFNVGGFLFYLLEGLIRLGVFLAYIALMPLIREIKITLHYHGAEHKSLHTYESGEELTVHNARKYSPLHARCGTAFLLIVLVLCVLLFSLIRSDNWYVMIVYRIILIPFVAGISYELLKLSAKYAKSRLVKLLITPGLWLQKLTTREPSDEQLEVALAALKEVIALELGG